ncbi:uncharacterized protein ARMOST_06168 [Armillaria ostoyae]|uniref:Uncharacterized protein n=1 Tax=Armillaria ostoyae TaxID=47428 RepID=A0A284R290_ARMOS|nr:uncharacterized protein ARMOST_06168 [Armillaria ostoyae]
MPALNVCLQVANIAEASGVPYLEKLAKVAVTVLELLEKRGKNKKDAKELSESIANTIIVIDTLVRMHGECASPYFEDICGAMAGYLDGIAQDLKAAQRKQRGIRGLFNIDEFRDAIQVYRKRVDDLKTDFLVHLMGDCIAKVIQRHATELKKRTVKHQSNDRIKRTKDIAHLMSAGMTGSYLEDAVRNMPPIPETPQVEPLKKRVSRQAARSLPHAQPTIPGPHVWKTGDRTSVQCQYSVYELSSRGPFLFCRGFLQTGIYGPFRDPHQWGFDNQSPLSEINYSLAMSSGLYDNTREFNSTYYSSYPTFNCPDTF